MPRFVLTFVILLATLAAVAERPNLVLFVADDMTYTDAGCYGNPEVNTPNLDRLATEGMRFTHAFSITAMCSPARQILYSGLYPLRSGAYPQRSRIYEHVRTMPRVLSELGYRVAIAGKTHYGPEEQYPFEMLSGKPIDFDNLTEFMTRDDEQPFCLVVCSIQPHTPWDHGDASVYDAETLRLPPYLADTPRTRELMTQYYGEVSYLDGQVGDTLRLLEENGLRDDTLFMFVSEQGSSVPFAKWTLYDAGIRAQCIVRWPGTVQPGSTTSAMMQYIDVLPTFVDLAGGEPGTQFDGKSLVSVLKGDVDELRDYVYGIHTNLGINSGNAYPIRAVRDRHHKLIWNLTPEVSYQNNLTELDREYFFVNSWREAAEAGNENAAFLLNRFVHRPEFELYDLDADPFELNNLAESAALQEVRVRLFEKLQAWMTEQGDEGIETELRAPERSQNRGNRASRPGGSDEDSE